MGCISSKHVDRASSSPFRDPHSPEHFLGSSSSLKNQDHDYDYPIEPLTNINNGIQDDDNTSKNNENHPVLNCRFRDDSDCDSIRGKKSLTEAEHAAAGWPSWLTAVAGEALHGWLPLKFSSFQRFEMIGRGASGCVYRARHTKSGRIYALKKVRFDLLHPKFMKLMSRELIIHRRLDHPNIIKLKGIITFYYSSNIYLVLEYMEHDLYSLLSSPNIKFSDSQIKCYMRQLLKGIEHCHSRGFLHRDIKSMNILMNSDGVLKIADFGLAKSYRQRELSTIHAVPLWYRPPELLLGCRKYGTYVDLWSIGCVFAEFFFRKPIITAQTEVKQLEEIFKLCGTPPDEYWNKFERPFAPRFHPHCTYESSLREVCKELPKTAVDLLATLLLVEPRERGTARSALESEYLKYSPNKEMDATDSKEAHG